MVRFDRLMRVLPLAWYILCTVCQWHCVWVVCIFWDTCTGKPNSTWLFSVYGLKRFVVSMNGQCLISQIKWHTVQTTWASYPDSHSQTPRSLVPKLSYPDSHSQTPRSLVPKLSYPNSHSQTLIPRPHRALFPSTVLCTSSVKFWCPKICKLAVMTPFPLPEHLIGAPTCQYAW